MDIKCPKCGEPWDIDSLHDAVAEGHAVDFADARRGFYVDGCVALGGSHNGGTANPAISILMELSGDDIDGLAADMEDFGL